MHAFSKFFVVKLRLSATLSMGVLPVRAVAVSTAAGTFLWLLGFPKWPVFLCSLLGFMGLGGLQFCRLVYHTLPRDRIYGEQVLPIVTVLYTIINHMQMLSINTLHGCEISVLIRAPSNMHVPAALVAMGLHPESS